MSVYYPQAGVSLRILWENFESENPLVKQEYPLVVTPKSMTVTINDYTQADTFSVELDYKNFPFDPRTIRAVGVTIFMEDMKGLFEGGEPIKIQPRENIVGGETNIVFQGFADKDSIQFNDGSRTVTLEGRDFTALFIDTPYDNKNPISMTTPLENVFGQLLLANLATKKMKIDQRGVEALPPLAKFAPDFNPLATERSKKRNESYWDVIQELSRRAGIISFVELDKLVLTKPNALYDEDKLKQFVWGSNLSDLTFSRKLGRTKNFNLEVRSMHLEKKEVLVAQIPRDATVAWSLKTGIKREQVKIEELTPKGEKREKVANVIAFRLADVADQDQLVEIGQNVFEEISRQQIEGTLETRDMCIQEGNPGSPIANIPMTEFDVTKIRNGTPINIRITQDDLAAIEKQSSLPARVKYLEGRCYDPKIAAVFASTLGKFKSNFYTKAVEFNLDSNTGFSMKLDFINFIELPESLVN